MFLYLLSPQGQALWYFLLALCCDNVGLQIKKTRSASPSLLKITGSHHQRVTSIVKRVWTPSLRWHNMDVCCTLPPNLLFFVDRCPLRCTEAVSLSEMSQNNIPSWHCPGSCTVFPFVAYTLARAATKPCPLWNAKSNLLGYALKSKPEANQARFLTPWLRLNTGLTKNN